MVIFDSGARSNATHDIMDSILGEVGIINTINSFLRGSVVVIFLKVPNVERIWNHP